MKKRIFIVIICFFVAFIAVLFLIKKSYNVSASTITDYNLVDVPDHTVIVSNEYYNELSYELILLPNIEYKLTFDYNIISTNANILVCMVGYGSDYYAYTLSIGNYYSVPEGKVDLQGSVSINFTTPSSFEISNPTLYVREVTQPGAFHNSFVEISNIVVQFTDEVLSNICINCYNDGYEQGLTEGTSFGYDVGYNDGYEQGLTEGYENGYDDGYTQGYSKGYNEGISGTLTANWFTSFISSVFDIFNIEIFPNVKLIYLFFIPIGLGIVLLILKLIRG